MSMLIMPRMWESLLTDVVSQKGRGSHAADVFLSYVERVTKKRVTERRLEAWFSQEDIDFVRALIPSHKKLYALSLGGGFARKLYPPSDYAALITI